jgi:hypothetical protein
VVEDVRRRRGGRDRRAAREEPARRDEEALVLGLPEDPAVERGALLRVALDERSDRAPPARVAKRVPRVAGMHGVPDDGAVGEAKVRPHAQRAQRELGVLAALGPARAAAEALVEAAEPLE